MTVTGFRDELEQLLKARFPLLGVQTSEEQRLLREVGAVVADRTRIPTPRAVLVWTSTRGLVRTAGDGTGGQPAPLPGTTDPARALDAALAVDEAAVVVFCDLHSRLGGEHRPPDPDVVRRLRETAAAFRSGAAARTLLLVSPVLHAPPELAQELTAVEFPLPGAVEVRALLDQMVASNAGGRIRIEVTEADLERLVEAAQGLTLDEAEDAFARAMVDDGALTPADVQVVLAEKRRTVRSSGLLDVVDVDVSLDGVGGLGALKRWLAQREGAWLEQARAYGLPAPRGALITGVPGCGKSLTAKAVAAAWGLPLLRLDVGRVFSGLVGSSEQNLRSSIRTAEAVAPCVLWVDEVEKGFAGAGGGGGDSGTSARVLGTFLTWLQEKTAPVFVIATANAIDGLPPELLRKGRFDEVFFVDLPTAAEREQIWQLHLRRGVPSAVAEPGLLEPEVVAELAARSEGFSGAEVEQAVVAALFTAYADRRLVGEQDLHRALASTVPLSTTQAEQVEALREWARLRAVAATAPEDGGPPPVAPVPSGGRTVDV